MKQKTISFSDNLFKKLETNWKQYNEDHNPTLNFSQFIIMNLKD